MEYSSIFIVSFIIIIILVNNKINNKDITYVYSNGIKYRVADLPDKQEAADLLNKINMKILRLIDHIKSKEDPKFKRLYNKYNKNSLHENLEYKRYKAYSLNKGEELVVCIRNPDGSLINDINTIMFVIIHELAHIMTKEIGHTKKFWNNMVILLHISSELNIYDIINYNEYPVNYCGMVIDKTPISF